MSIIQANMHEAKTQLSKLVSQALAGEEVVIAKAGIPLVRLTPVTFHDRELLGSLQGQAVIPDDILDPMSEEELAEWE